MTTGDLAPVIPFRRAVAHRRQVLDASLVVSGDDQTAEARAWGDRQTARVEPASRAQLQHARHLAEMARNAGCAAPDRLLRLAAQLVAEGAA